MDVVSHDVLTQRYGAPSPLRRRAVVAVSTVVAMVFLAWLAWTAVAHGDPDVSSDLVTWSIEGEHTASARVSVRLGDDDVTASCLLRAVAEDHTIVGELRFDVDAATLAGGGTLGREVRTERRATTVQLIGCTTPDQARPQ
jgi:hypothetical protein